MRLGDLDALREEICSWGMNDYEPSDFIDAIDEAPTIETTIENLICTLSVEELKVTTRIKVDIPSGEAICFRREETGHWIDDGQYAEGHSEHYYRCSECGGHIIAIRVDDFCKHCGAKMTGGAE